MIQQLNLDKAKVMAAFEQSVDWASGLDSLRPERTGSEARGTQV
jgi:hypothetical protein